MAKVDRAIYRWREHAHPVGPTGNANVVPGDGDPVPSRHQKRWCCVDTHGACIKRRLERIRRYERGVPSILAVARS